MLFAVKENEPPYPMNVGFFCFPGVAAVAHMAANLVQQFDRVAGYGGAYVVHGCIYNYCVYIQYYCFRRFQDEFSTAR